MLGAVQVSVMTCVHAMSTVRTACVCVRQMLVKQQMGRPSCIMAKGTLSFYITPNVKIELHVIVTSL